MYSTKKYLYISLQVLKGTSKTVLQVDSRKSECSKKKKKNTYVNYVALTCWIMVVIIFTAKIDTLAFMI